MSNDHIRYDLLVQDALRSVVRHVLIDAGKHGLPGEHHFYISFKTGAPGVRISNRLREQYPDEMTIVLQHQFWDMGVTEHTLEVGLSFGGVPERLLVPFDAIVGFFDPSVQFGLKFEVQDPEAVAENDDVEGTDKPKGLPRATAEISAMPAPKAAGGVLKQQDKGKATPEAAQDTAPGRKAKGKVAKPTEPGTEAPQPTAAVVSLDAFRKKK